MQRDRINNYIRKCFDLLPNVCVCVCVCVDHYTIKLLSLCSIQLQEALFTYSHRAQGECCLLELCSGWFCFQECKTEE